MTLGPLAPLTVSSLQASHRIHAYWPCPPCRPPDTSRSLPKCHLLWRSFPEQLQTIYPQAHPPTCLLSPSPLHFLPGTDHHNTCFSLSLPPPARIPAPLRLILSLFCSCLYSQPSEKCLAQSRGSTICVEGLNNKKGLAQSLTPSSCSVNGTTAV